ncbi:hypothetical protein NLL39_03250 [Corynebacterium accolens]|uniref:hypothetical protein n=1 Tax=Corynebacterium accolens TaxID=38284 RepID=UPI002670498E|nr:hypothetical protein [Corynebacterium accolens]WKS63098.1 hypothetical protein NLL39_03250 [Corynebacterium accolens]
MNRKLRLSLATGFLGVVLVIAAPILINMGIDTADAGQQSGNAVVPLLLAGLGTVLVILALARSGPVFEKYKSRALEALEALVLGLHSLRDLKWSRGHSL